jgi:regulator of nucleoside diphosphate kinase
MLSLFAPRERRAYSIIVLADDPKRIYLTELDVSRLESLLAVSQKTKNVLDLEEELARAVVVPVDEIPADVVTMNSKVRFADQATGESSEVTVVYPRHADVEAGKVSVLAPIGTALLGLKVGETIEWTMPTGKTRKLEIINVLYQPEAAGDTDL